MNHYGNTWKTIKGTYTLIQKHTMFLELTSHLCPDTEQVWNLTYPDMAYIPEEWQEISQKMQTFLAPTCVDLIRFRHVDFSSIMYEILANAAIRMDFIRNISTMTEENIQDNPSSLAKALVRSGNIRKVHELGQDITYDENLYNVIMDFRKMDEQ